MRAALLTLVVLLAPIAGCVQDAASDRLAQGDASTGGAIEPGPFWSFVDTAGTTHSRDTAAGAPVVLFFMASWCPSCQRLTQELKAVHATYAARDVHFYSISWDPSDDNESLEAWKERFEQPWPHGVDPAFQTQRTFGVHTQSSVVVLDGHGRVVERFGYGQASRTNLPPVLDAALEASASGQP